MSRIEDEREIGRLLVAYATAIDTHDHAGLDRVFLPTSRLDFRAVGGRAGSYAELRPWLDARMAGYEVLQHLLGNMAIEVDGDAARATTYLRATHGYRVDGELRFFEIGGLYEDELVRGADGFRIVARTLHHRFTLGALPPRR